MTPLECKRLQSMDELDLPTRNTRAYAALGNAINVKVAQLVANALLATGDRGPAPNLDKVEWVPDPGQLALKSSGSADHMAIAPQVRG